MVPRSFAYTQLVYSAISGTKKTVTQNMICNVLRLDTASHAVRLLSGTDDDGMMNGNMERPAVRITPATTMALATRVRVQRRRPTKTTTPNAPMNVASGAPSV